MCEHVTPRRAFRSVPEEHIFKGKVGEIEEKRCQLLQPPSSEGSCTLSSCRGTAAPTGALFPFFFQRGKTMGLLLQSQGLPARRGLPLWAEDATVPLGSQSGSWHKREDEVKAVLGPPAGTIS